MKSMRFAPIGCAVFMVLGSVVGCGGGSGGEGGSGSTGASISGICEAICGCEGCSVQGCVDLLDDARRRSEDMGCTAEMNAVLACMDDTLRCESGEAKDDCDAAWSSDRQCRMDEPRCKAYIDAYVARHEACGLSDGEPPCNTPERAESAECLLPCIEKIVCTCIDPALGDQCTEEMEAPYKECEAACPPF